MEIGINNVYYRDKLININYKFDSGKVTSIIGNSGAGKSLIGFIIMGLIRDYQGYISIDGKRDYDQYELLRSIGYVFQNPYDHFICKTVYEEVLYGLKQFKYKEDRQDKQVRDALKMVGIDSNYFNRDVSKLSSGEMERVAIASSLVMNPSVLILDEATIYLDSLGKSNLIKLIKMLRDKYKKTIIIMSNDMDFVYAVSDNYVLMDKGKIIREGKIDDMRKQDRVLSSCDVSIPIIDNFVSYVKRYKNVDLSGVTSIDDIVSEVDISD